MVHKLHCTNVDEFQPPPSPFHPSFVSHYLHCQNYKLTLNFTFLTHRTHPYFLKRDVIHESNLLRFFFTFLWKKSK